MGKTKNIDRDKVMAAIFGVNKIGVELFGKGCAFDEGEALEAVLGSKSLEKTAPDLLKQTEKASLKIRQCMIIRIVGDVHDYEVEQREKGDAPITASEYAWCMPWYLLGVSQILMVTDEPEVVKVLTAFGIYRPKKQCHLKTVGDGDAIYKDGFSEVFMEYSENYRKKYGVASDDDLLRKIQEGKAFYPQQPMIVSEDIRCIQPVIPLMIVRDIKNQRAIV